MAEIARQRVYHHQDLWDKFWKNKHGEVVVYQTPNVFLIAWLVVTIASLFTNGMLSSVLWWVALGIIAVWSLLEILKGVNYLRRCLGVLVLVLTIAAVFKVGY